MKYQIFVLDFFTRSTISTGTAEWSQLGIIFVNDLSEITEEMLTRTKTVFVAAPYFNNPDAMAQVRVLHTMFNLEFIFLGLDEAWFNEMQQYGKVYRADVSLITHDVLMAALYNDSTLEGAKNDTSLFDDSLELAKSVIENPNGETSYRLAMSLLSMDRRFSEQSAQAKEQREQLQKLSAHCSVLEKENKKLEEGYTKILRDSFKLYNTLQEYEGILTRDIYEKVDLGKYNTKPLVLYFKEYEEILNFQYFVQTLYELFRMHEKNSVKILMLFDSKTSRRMKVLPDYVKQIHNKYMTRDVLMNDFIAKSGDHRQILDLLLTNKILLNFLIIIDCKNYNDVTITGSYLPFNLCREPAHLQSYELSLDNTIVSYPVEGSQLVFDEVRTDLATKEDTFLYLSNKEVFQRILELTRIFQKGCL